MKHLVCILLILIGSFTACQQRSVYPPAMQQAEALMNTRPDSALLLLESMADTLDMLPEEARMYHQLLTIQAKDKQYITHTGDSLINRIVDFYENYGDKDRLMMAYFYQGSTYRDMNDAPRALKAFQQAVDLNVPNLDLLAKTYNQMGTLFMYQGLHDEVIRVNRKSIELYLSQGKQNKISYALRDIARMYDVKGMPDSALHYYKEACQTALTDGDSARYYGILGELGGIYFQMDSFLLAKRTLQTVMSNREEHKCSHLFPYLGYIYEKEAAFDSAFYFYQKVLQYGNIQQRYYAYQNLFNMANAQKRQTEANSYIKEAFILKGQLEKNKQTEAIAKANSLYNYQHTESKYQDLLSKQSLQDKWETGLAALIFLVTTTCIAFILYNKKKAPQKSKNQNQHIECLSKEQETLIKNLKNSPIYNRFYWAANNPTIKISHDDWMELQQAINATYQDFTKRLYELNPSFSVQAIQICCLIKISMPSASIARILGRSRSAISLACNRYYEKIHHTKGDAEMFRQFIKNF